METLGAARFEYDLFEERHVNVSLSRSLKILVVDDNRDFANILSSYFSYLGFMSRTAYGEVFAMEKVLRIKPDLIFCDIGLPGKGGYKLADQIRSDRSSDSILLVALTYIHNERLRQYTLAHGFDAYISRPIRAAQLEVLFEQAVLRQLQYGRPMELVNAG